MKIAGLIIFALIGARAGWRTWTVMKGGETAVLPNSITSVLGAIAGCLLYWFLTINIGGLIGSLVIAVLGGLLLLFLMGFFKKNQTRQQKHSAHQGRSD